MCYIQKIVIILLLFEINSYSTDALSVKDTMKEKTDSNMSGYRIDQPGTITFTVGVKISGKVEKPQVMIFLPKEKTLHREESFDHSFKEDLKRPLRLRIID